MAESKVLHLKFKTANDKIASLTITNPREDITLEEAQSVADVIIKGQVFESNAKIPFTAFATAEIVETTATPLN
ncbi:MAG: DUF2922 domain-containing protein [Veillonella sp.]|nr:DUF2922 domain-containing protein [Veillonella sp.]MCF0155733.1 DUF2922 domain-containing protein [Veillonella sp.]